MVSIISGFWGMSRPFWDLFVRVVAGLADEETPHKMIDHVGEGESLVTADAADHVVFVAHICIRGKTRQTEGDFSDFFWVVLRFFSS